MGNNIHSKKPRAKRYESLYRVDIIPVIRLGKYRPLFISPSVNNRQSLLRAAMFDKYLVCEIL